MLVREIWFVESGSAAPPSRMLIMEKFDNPDYIELRDMGTKTPICLQYL